MNSAEVKWVYLFFCLVLSLAILSPILMASLAFPSGEGFSELYMLDKNQMTEDYPFNVSENEVYSVFLAVGNHMGYPNYYILSVKFKNQTEPLPKATADLPSSLSPLYEYRIFVGDDATNKVPLTFSLAGVTFSNGTCSVQNIVVNGYSFIVNKAVSWNPDKKGYYFQLFVELWTCNSASNECTYNNRYVSLWLNVTNV